MRWGVATERTTACCKVSRNSSPLVNSILPMVDDVVGVFFCRCSEEIDYVMMCVDANQDGKVDFNEFTDRFHSPAKDIGFNVAVLLTNLSEHIPNDSRQVYHPIFLPPSPSK